MSDAVPMGSPEYLAFFGLLVFSRGMDFLSTWVATPTLALEANPIARWLGWRWGILVNLVLCGTFAHWPLSAVVICTISVLVAARNFQSAPFMRAMGETRYQLWFREQMSGASRRLFVICLLAQSILIVLVGVGLVCFSSPGSVSNGVGIGLIGYAVAVLLYTLIALRRRRNVVL